MASSTLLFLNYRMKNFGTYRFLAMLDLTVSLTSWSTNPLLKDSVSTSCAWVSEGVPSCTKGDMFMGQEDEVIVYSPFPPI